MGTVVVGAVVLLLVVAAVKSLRKDKKNGKGTKKEPDVFFGVKKDVWSAIAVGVTWMEKMEEEKREKENEKRYE